MKAFTKSESGKPKSLQESPKAPEAVGRRGQGELQETPTQTRAGVPRRQKELVSAFQALAPAEREYLVGQHEKRPFTVITHKRYDNEGHRIPNNYKLSFGAHVENKGWDWQLFFCGVEFNAHNLRTRPYLVLEVLNLRFQIGWLWKITDADS